VPAQFSTAFGIALMLVQGSSTPADYMNPALWADHDIAAVIDKVAPCAHDFGPSAPLLSARIDITLHDGRTLSGAQHGFRGHPAIPAAAKPSKPSSVPSSAGSSPRRPPATSSHSSTARAASRT
jgi:hypothetical protein